MNRTPTRGKVLALLEEEHTVAQLRDALGVTHDCAYQAVRRLQSAGKLERRVDGEREVWWRAKQG